jgi:multidrug efflux pump
MLSFWKFFLHNRQFTILIITALIAAGIYSLLSLPKENSPEVRIPIGIVTSILPGASAADVERLVTNKLEDGLNNIKNLDKLTSTSHEGLSVVVVHFIASADIDKSMQDLKSEVDKIKPELPDEAESPSVTEANVVNTPILLISVSGEYSPEELTALGDFLKDELKSVKGVSEVQVSGVRDREVQVIVNQAKLDQYRLRLVDVVAAIQSSNAALPIGSISMDGVQYALKFAGDIADPKEVRDIALVSSNGTPVYVRDIAEVFNGLEDSKNFSRVSSGGAPAVPSLTLSIFKSSGGNIVKTTEEVKEKLEELKKTTLSGGNVLVQFDAGDEINRNLFDLTETGLITVVLVMITLFLTIGWRESVVAALSIPLSFLIAFIGLQVMGNTINFVSLFSLILAIGILVDSGIVVTEAIHTRSSLYPTKTQAAEASLVEYAQPLMTGTLATIAMFVPLFFISGIVGKFIFAIPFTLISVLLASIFVALGLVPLIAILFSKTEMNRLEIIQENYTHRVQTWYRAKLNEILEDRRTQNIFLWTIFVLFFVALALPVTGVVKSIFFPQDDLDFVYVEIEKPEGTTLEETDLATRAVEEKLYDISIIDSFVTTIGANSVFQQNTASGPKFANITVLLPKKGERDMTSTEVVDFLRKTLSEVKTADVHVYEPSNGPPTGAPVVIKFIGDDLDKLEAAVSKAQDILESIPGTSEVNTSTKNNGTQFTLTVDKAKATALGLSPVVIAQTLRTAVNGVTATTIKKQEQDIDVIVKLNVNASYSDPSETNQATPDAIREISIQTPRGPVLLGSVLKTSAERSNAIIQHEDRKRLESVSAFTTPDATAGDINAKFLERQAELNLPSDVEMQIGGENEDIDKSFQDMGLAFFSGLFLMFAILVLEFNSFRYAGWLILMVLLSLIGVFGGLAITGQPLSFSSLLGVIALAGVIINHAIILIDSLSRIEKANPGWTHKEIVVEAANSRLRPIVLTTITTVVGMIPLVSVSALWGPLAFAIMFGLSFSMLLTLVVIPIFYYRWPGKKAVEQ